MQHTSSDVTVVTEEKITVDESDIHNIIKKELDLEESKFLFDINSVKDEFNINVSEYSVASIHTIIKEEVVVNEHDAQLLEEYLSSDVRPSVNDVIRKDSQPAATITDSKTGPSKALILSQLSTQFKTNKKHGKNYECHICKKTFTRASGLSGHSLLHVGIKKYKCVVCNKAFTWSSALARHKLIHSGIKKYKCDECNKCFTLSTHLSQHKLTHSDTKMYNCNICTKGFSRLGILSKHKVIHIIKKHLCNVCNKTFTELSDLLKHQLIHSTVKKYQCNVCNKDFSYLANLSKHKLSHNVDKK